MDKTTEQPTEETVVETVEETVEETTEVAETSEEATTEETTEKTTEETEETPEVEEQPVVFEAADDETVFAEKAEKVLAKFDLEEAPELKSYIQALEARAKAVETPEIFTQIADYGDVDAIKSVLDEHNSIYSRREEDGGYRPNTDKFAQSLATKDQATADFLYYDLASLPSTKYQGVNKFEEGIVEALSVEGDTVGSALARYHSFIRSMKDGAMPTSDIPTFIPVELHSAYRALPKETRVDIESWADLEDFETERANKLIELRSIQKGIDADLAEQKREAENAVARQQRFFEETQQTQQTFVSEMRNEMAAKLEAVQFSPDPKLNKLLAAQQITTLTQAFSDDADGEFARAALAEAGINFDKVKAQSLLVALNEKSAALTVAKNAVDKEGKHLNPVGLKQAQSAFAEVTKEWLKFADDIVRQEKEVALAGTAKAVEAVVEKRKVAPKVRPVSKGIGTSAEKRESLPPYGTPAWDAYWARKTLEEQAARAGAYA